MQTILFFDDDNIEEPKPMKTQTRSPRARKKRTPKKISLDEVDIDDEEPSIHIPNPEIAPIYVKDNEINETSEKNTIIEDVKEIDYHKIEEIKKLQQNIIRLPGYTLEFNLIPYEFRNWKKISLHGTRQYYQLLKNNNTCYTSKIKSGNELKNVLISQGGEMHFSSITHEAELKIINSNQTYVLLKSRQQKMEISFQVNEIKDCPRHCRVIFFDSIDDIETAITRKKIQIFGEGIWIMDLNGRKGIKSAKNCIMVDSNQNEILSIMRTSDNTACIEAHPNLPELYVFAFGLASYICPFH